MDSASRQATLIVGASSTRRSDEKIPKPRNRMPFNLIQRASVSSFMRQVYQWQCRLSLGRVASAFLLQKATRPRQPERRHRLIADRRLNGCGLRGAEAVIQFHPGNQLLWTSIVVLVISTR